MWPDYELRPIEMFDISASVRQRPIDVDNYRAAARANDHQLLLHIRRIRLAVNLALGNEQIVAGLRFERGLPARAIFQPNHALNDIGDRLPIAMVMPV